MICLAIRIHDFWKRPDFTIRGELTLRCLRCLGIAALVLTSSPSFSADATSSASVEIEFDTSGISSETELVIVTPVVVPVVELPTGSTTNVDVGAPIAESPPENVDAVDTSTSSTSDSGSIQQQLRAAAIARSSIQPARFSVFGSPNQVFSLTIPTTATSASGGENGDGVTVSDFLHDAGVTPMVGGGGFTSFSVGAGAQASATSPDDGGTSPDGAAGEGEAENTDASANPKDPFGFDANIPGFLSVSVSYN